jgi:hypothetical protein
MSGVIWPVTDIFSHNGLIPNSRTLSFAKTDYSLNDYERPFSEDPADKLELSYDCASDVPVA